MLAVLLATQGRVVGRRELARQAGMADLSERRCDSVLVGIRRLLGAEALITVRSRGWRLADHVIGAAHEVLGQRSPESAGQTNAALRS